MFVQSKINVFSRILLPEFLPVVIERFFLSLLICAQNRMETTIEEGFEETESIEK